jgi:hypothetical protein
MRRFIKNMILIFIAISIIGVQAVFAADSDLNTYIYNHLKNMDTEFNIPYYTTDLEDSIKQVTQNDNYLRLSIEKFAYKIKGHNITLNVTYRLTKEQENYVDEELKKIINCIITDNMSNFEKVKAINQYLINRFEYDDSLVSNNPYSALTTGKTTCQGYAMTTYKLLKLAGIENKIIVGDLQGVPHGWNLVKLNDKWYDLDITNNDAVGSYKYFLRNDSILKNDGFTWDSSKYPECSENYATGWNLINNKWCFFDDAGEIKTGWISYNSKWYYCYPYSGEMAVNTVINGYTVDLNGAWIA